MHGGILVRHVWGDLVEIRCELLRVRHRWRTKRGRHWVADEFQQLILRMRRSAEVPSLGSSIEVPHHGTGKGAP